MDRRHLVAFQTVARTGSVTGAAAELGYSQSAVTAQIKSLESTLHVQLFDRSRSGVRLTSSGEQFLPYAARILRLAEEAKACITDKGTEISGSLVVGANETVMTYRLPMLMKRFREECPNVRSSLRIFHEGNQTILRSLSQGEIDIALFHAMGDPAGQFEVARILDEQVVLVAPPGHPLADLDAVTTADLRRTRLLVSRADCIYGKVLESELGDLELRADPPLQLGTLEAVKNAVAGTRLGVAVLPRVAAAEFIAEDKVAELPWTPHKPVDMYATWHGNPGPASPVPAFVRLLRREARQRRNVLPARAPQAVTLAASARER